MERGPILTILQEMKGTEKELDMILWGEDNPIEIRNVLDVETLRSANGIRVTTKQNYIWFDASHVSAMWQARTDLDQDTSVDFIPSSHNRITAV